MTAFGVAMHLGYLPSTIAEALRDAPAVPGRLQRVRTEHDGGVSVYVDELKNTEIVTYRPETPVGAEVKELVSAHDLTVRQWCDDEITLGSVVDVEPELVGISLKTLGLAPFPQLHTLRIKEVEPGFHPVYLIYRKNAHKTRAVVLNFCISV